MLTADHLIEPLDSFAQTLDEAFTLAEERADALVTFGVVPDAPATGFGYLELGEPLGAGHVVGRFVEKPTLSRAAEYLAAGPSRYLWNSGMFVWRAETLLRAVDEFSPHAGLVLRAMGAGLRHPALGAARRRRVADGREAVGRLRRHGAGVDVATLFTVAALPLAARWLDVGSWPAYGEALGRDEAGNAVGAARAVLHASRDCVVASSDPDAPRHARRLRGARRRAHARRRRSSMPADDAQRVKELHALVQEQAPELA